jgi:gliding motility-associated-like protein
VVVTASDGTVTYTLKVIRKSNDDALSALTLSSGTLAPAFSSTTTAYTASVGNGTASITLTPTKRNAYAAITINGVMVNSGTASPAQAIAVGDNPIPIVVTAQNGAKKTYMVTVTRAASGLNSLYLPGGSSETPLVSSLGEKVEANNILSPNGDGINDIWVVKNIAFYPGNTVTVYDLAGKVVFTRKGYTNDWDGTYRGSVLGEGIYYFKIDLGNGTTKKGFITVVRNR